jgi:plastocyanin
MKAYLSGIIVAVLAASGQFGSAAEISGKVKLKGTPKPEIPIQMEPNCGKLNPKPVTTRHYVVGQDNGLGNVFVYVKSGAQKTPATGEGPVLDQLNCMYEPYILGVVAGQKMKVKNSDPLMHNVHPTPKNNKEANFAQPVKGQVNEVTFDKPEVLMRVKCDVHQWMFAYIGVVDHPYFAVTDKDGNFKISNLPPGKYTIEAYHLKAGTATQELQVDKDKKDLNFELEAK